MRKRLAFKYLPMVLLLIVVVAVLCVSRYVVGSPASWAEIFIWPEGVTACALILTLFVIAWQSCETRSAADAALLNAKAVITSERPWLVGHFIQNGSEEFTETKPMKFLCEIKNEGKTPAILINAAARAVFTTGAEPLPDEPDYGHADPLERVLVPGATYFFWAGAEGYEWKDDGRWVPLEKTELGKMHILVGFGCVRYRDTFGKTEEHFTRFCECATTGSKTGILYDKRDMPPARVVQVNGPFSPWEFAPSKYTECR